MSDLRTCPECGREIPREDLSWVNDRHGIPYKLVCDSCYDRVAARIGGYTFDPADAGEYLEPEDY